MYAIGELMEFKEQILKLEESIEFTQGKNLTHLFSSSRPFLPFVQQVPLNVVFAETK
jgi:hypothetical protein